jgi:hypothetical protein
LLTRIYTDTGTIVSFYEPSPGYVLTAEGGPMGATSHQAAITGLSPTKAFATLAPHSALPQALVDAEARRTLPVQSQTAAPVKRVGSSPATGSEFVVPPAEGALAQTVALQSGNNSSPYCASSPPNTGHFDPTWFANNACTFAGSPYPNFTWCLFNRGGHAWADDNWSESMGYGSVAASINNIQFQVQASHGNWNATWTIPQGNWWWAESATPDTCNSWPIGCGDDSPWNDNEVRFDVYGSGAMFHFCGWMNDW